MNLSQLKAELVRLREIVQDPEFDELPRYKRVYFVDEYMAVKKAIQQTEKLARMEKCRC